MAKRFQKVHVEITNICNLQCSFCPEVLRAKKLIDLTLFENIIRQVAPLTEQVAFHLMGDPLVHSGLEQLLEICLRYETKVFFVTNGVLLREKQTELLLHPALRQVNFSLHSFFDNYPDRDARPYLERIFKYTERALTERPDLYLNYRLWNLKEVRGQSSMNQWMLNEIGKRFGITPPTSLDVRLKKSFPIKGRLYLHFDTEFVWPSLEAPLLHERGRCFGLSSHFGILVDGTVVPCCLDKEGKIPLGNIQERELTAILEDPRSLAILSGFKKGRLEEELCKRCQYIERFQPNGLKTPRFVQASD